MPTDRGVTPGLLNRRFAKSEAKHQDSLTGYQESLLALDRKRQRRQEAMALAATQKSRPSKPPRAPAAD
jgi:hypothetical protein